MVSAAPFDPDPDPDPNPLQSVFQTCHVIQVLVVAYVTVLSVIRKIHHGPVLASGNCTCQKSQSCM